VQLGFNLSNGETDTLESSSLLIILETHMGLHKMGLDAVLIKWLIKKMARGLLEEVN